MRMNRRCDMLHVNYYSAYWDYNSCVLNLFGNVIFSFYFLLTIKSNVNILVLSDREYTLLMLFY